MNDNNSVLFTIITVCYNAEKTIEDTVKSVLDQDFDDFEYIIVDGASTDKTADIIQALRDKDEGSRIRFISEPDNGLYDAMNKGIKLSSGQYIQFLNSGDEFIDSSVLSRVARKIRDARADVYYGNIIYRYPDGTTAKRVYGSFCSTGLYYLLGDCINHQAIFASRDCFLPDRFFDTSYRFSADREWMIRIKKSGRQFCSINETICYYSLDEDSQSVANDKAVWDENRKIVRKYFPSGYPVYCLVDAIRNTKLLSGMLHKMYEIVFIRNTK